MDRREKWLEIIKMNEVKEWHRICSIHFNDDDYTTHTKYFTLKKHAMPMAFDRHIVTYFNENFSVTPENEE